MTSQGQRQAAPLYAGAHQPTRRGFGFADVMAGDRRLPVETREIAKSPFYRLVEFAAPDIRARADLLIVAPLSGHFAFLTRDLVAGLLPFFRVYITDWSNIRHIPARYGTLGLEGNISCVLECMRKLPPGLNVLGLCQGGVPALASTALLAANGDAKMPANLILMASPIDPLASPSRIVEQIRSRPMSWFEETVIAAVPDGYAGCGRRVYPANLHLLPLWTYLTRHASAGSDTGTKLFFDDGADPGRFPFLDLFTSIMDLDAAFFVENTRDVFHDCLLRNGALSFRGERVEPGAISTAGLLTVEGGRDDIAAPGHSGAAHGLCKGLPVHLHHSLIVPGAGHFSLFYGETWRREVLPKVVEFCSARKPICAKSSSALVRVS